MTATLRAEWTKLRTQRGALIALALTAALMVGFTALNASQSHTDGRGPGDDDIVQYGLAGILFAQIGAAIVGASLMTSEFASDMIRTTLVATQSRARVLLAKAGVLAVAMFPVALVSSAAAFVIAQSLLRQNGYVAPAYPPAGLTDGPVARAVVGTALLLTLYALLALGIATVFHHSAATIGACVAVLFFPIVALNLVPEPWARWLERTAPLAGIAIQDTTGRVLAGFGGGSTDDVQVARDGTMTITHPPAPIGHWAGLGIAAAWTLGALVVGYLVLRRRDV